MADLKDLLERRARRFRPANDDDGFGRLLDRADKRHTRKRITAGVVALAVAVVGSLGVYAMLGRGTTGRPSDGGNTFAAIWPQKNESDAMIAQSRANRGDSRLTWQQNAEKFVWQFGNDGLSWVRTTIPHIAQPEADGNGPLVVTFRGAPAADCTYPNDASDWSCPESAFKTAVVTMQRLLQPDKAGVWSVTNVLVDGASITLENSPLPPVETTEPVADVPEEVGQFVTDFMDARAADGYQASALAYLSADAKHSFDAHEGGLDLYGYLAGGQAWRITGTHQAGGGYRVVVEITPNGSTATPSHTAAASIYETVTIGPGPNYLGDQRDLLILTAVRNE